MKRTYTLLMIAAALIAASPSKSQTYDGHEVDRSAFATVAAIAYHAGCEKLPDDFAYEAAMDLKTIPAAKLEPAMKHLQYLIKREGGAEGFCKLIKPHIEKIKAR